MNSKNILYLFFDHFLQGWWKGEVDGKVGVFPDNFVKLIVTNTAVSIKIKQYSVMLSDNILSSYNMILIKLVYSI